MNNQWTVPLETDIPLDLRVSTLSHPQRQSIASPNVNFEATAAIDKVLTTNSTNYSSQSHCQSLKPDSQSFSSIKDFGNLYSKESLYRPLVSPPNKTLSMTNVDQLPSLPTLPPPMIAPNEVMASYHSSTVMQYPLPDFGNDIIPPQAQSQAQLPYLKSEYNFDDCLDGVNHPFTAAATALKAYRTAMDPMSVLPNWTLYEATAPLNPNGTTAAVKYESNLPYTEMLNTSTTSSGSNTTVESISFPTIPNFSRYTLPPPVTDISSFPKLPLFPNITPPKFAAGLPSGVTSKVPSKEVPSKKGGPLSKEVQKKEKKEETTAMVENNGGGKEEFLGGEHPTMLLPLPPLPGPPPHVTTSSSTMMRVSPPQMSTIGASVAAPAPAVAAGVGVTPSAAVKIRETRSNGTRYAVKYSGFLCNERCYFPGNDPTKPWRCPDAHCKSRFRSQPSLESHYRMHTEFAYVCQYCNKRCARQSNLKEHLRVHTNERPFRCNFCSKAFKQRHNLSDHLRCHTGEKPFECDVCSKKFTVKHNMVKHKQLHLKTELSMSPL